MVAEPGSISFTVGSSVLDRPTSAAYELPSLRSRPCVGIGPEWHPGSAHPAVKIGCTSPRKLTRAAGCVDVVEVLVTVATVVDVLVTVVLVVGGGSSVVVVDVVEVLVTAASVVDVVVTAATVVDVLVSVVLVTVVLVVGVGGSVLVVDVLGTVVLVVEAG